MALAGTGQHGRQRISRPVLYKLSHAMQRGSIVQEHTLYGLDGLAPAGTVRPILGRDGNAEDEADRLGIGGVIASFRLGPMPHETATNEPRFGMIMNPYLPPGAIVRQLFVTEPFYDTIAVVNLTVFGTAPYQVFGLASVTRISSPALNLPVDLTPVKRDKDNVSWASNTTLDDGSDFYVANHGDSTIVRMRQDGTVVAIRRVTVNWRPLDACSEASYRSHPRRRRYRSS